MLILAFIACHANWLANVFVFLFNLLKYGVMPCDFFPPTAQKYVYSSQNFKVL